MLKLNKNVLDDKSSQHNPAIHTSWLSIAILICITTGLFAINASRDVQALEKALLFGFASVQAIHIMFGAMERFGEKFMVYCLAFLTMASILLTAYSVNNIIVTFVVLYALSLAVRAFIVFYKVDDTQRQTT